MFDRFCEQVDEAVRIRRGVAPSSGLDITGRDHMWFQALGVADDWDRGVVGLGSVC